MFGREYASDDIEPTLEQVGRKQLYDASRSPTDELRRLNKVLLQLFLRLVQFLCIPPAAAAAGGREATWSETAPHEKLLRDIEDVFVNMQYLINSMRPSQAAIDLKELLDKQTESRKALSLRLQDVISQAWKLVSDAANELSKPSVEMSPDCLATLETLPELPDSLQHHPRVAPPLQRAPSDVVNNAFDDLSDEDDPEAFISRPRPPQDQMLLRISQLVTNPNLGWD